MLFILYNKIFFYNYKHKIFIYDSKIKGPTIFILGSVHGNEPAGTITSNTIIKDLSTNNKKDKIIIKKGKLIILPIPNPYGLKYNSRFQLSLFNPDINRSYIGDGVDKINKLILSIAKKSDYIVDLHEGWGFHKINRNSIGSTITINTSPNYDKLNNIGYKIVDILNNKIINQNKKFTLLKRNNLKCNPYGSLGCWSEINKKKYILVETSGQYNIQKIPIRVNQQKTII